MNSAAISKYPVSLSVVIAAYDEAENLEKVVEQTRDNLEGVVADFEIILVDDGSRDNTAEVAYELAAAEPRLRVIRHGQNRGFGASLITGYANARLDLVAPLPGDGQIPPSELKKYLPLMSDHDIVIGMRPRRPYTSYRKLLHGGLAWLTKLFFGRNHPPSAGSCMFRREVFDNLRLISTSGFANTEFAVKAARQGYRLGMVYIDTAPRLGGKSKMANAPTILVTFTDMLRSRWSLRG